MLAHVLLEIRTHIICSPTQQTLFEYASYSFLFPKTWDLRVEAALALTDHAFDEVRGKLLSARLAWVCLDLLKLRISIGHLEIVSKLLHLAIKMLGETRLVAYCRLIQKLLLFHLLLDIGDHRSLLVEIFEYLVGSGWGTLSYFIRANNFYSFLFCNPTLSLHAYYSRCWRLRLLLLLIWKLRASRSSLGGQCLVCETCLSDSALLTGVELGPVKVGLVWLDLVECCWIPVRVGWSVLLSVWIHIRLIVWELALRESCRSMMVMVRLGVLDLVVVSSGANLAVLRAWRLLLLVTMVLLMLSMLVAIRVICRSMLLIMGTCLLMWLQLRLLSNYREEVLWAFAI